MSNDFDYHMGASVCLRDRRSGGELPQFLADQISCTCLSWTAGSIGGDLPLQLRGPACDKLTKLYISADSAHMYFPASLRLSAACVQQ
jgi:hypothetical protein